MTAVQEKKRIYLALLDSVLASGDDPMELKAIHNGLQEVAAAEGTKISKSRETTRAYLDRLVADGALWSRREPMPGALVQTRWVYARN